MLVIEKGQKHKNHNKLESTKIIKEKKFVGSEASMVDFVSK